MKRHAGTNELNETLPKWTLVETKDTPGFNAAHGSCEIAPISSGSHLAFIKIDIVFHARRCLCGWFSVITIHLGLIKTGILSDYLKIFTWQHNVCATDFVLLQQSRYMSLLPPVSLGWVTILALFTGATRKRYESSPERCFRGHSYIYVCCTWASLTRKLLQRTSVSSEHPWLAVPRDSHVWSLHRALRIVSYVILAVFDSNQMSLSVETALGFSTTHSKTKGCW